MIKALVLISATAGSPSTDQPFPYLQVVQEMAILSEYVTSCPEGQNYKNDLIALSVNSAKLSHKPLESVAEDVMIARAPLDQRWGVAPVDDKIEVCTKMQIHFIQEFHH